MLKRRGFLKGTTGFAVGLAGAGPLVFFGAPQAGEAGGFGALSREKFEALAGSWMHLDAGDGAGWEPVRLMEVAGGPDSDIVEQFSILLRSERALELAPGMYDFDAGADGAFTLYLEPSPAGEDGQHYTATFSLIRPIMPSCAGAGILT